MITQRPKWTTTSILELLIHDGRFVILDAYHIFSCDDSKLSCITKKGKELQRNFSVSDIYVYNKGK